MRPRNFPGRVELRRVRAERRSGATVTPEEEQQRVALARGERTKKRREDKRGKR